MRLKQKSNAEAIYGIHAVSAVMQRAPHRILNLYILQGRQDKALQHIVAQAHEHGIAIQPLSRHELNQLTAEQNHQGIVAQCRQLQQYTEADIESLLQGLKVAPLILVLDGVQDPHNLGACLRTADAAGVHLVLAPKDHSVGITPVVRKVACGAAESVPFIQVANLARTIRLLKESGIWFYGTAGEASKSVYETKLIGAVGLVMGAEGKGLRRLTAELCDDLLYIPMLGTVESLNVSVATGVCLYEVVRQRKCVLTLA